jgi:uncharacterized BrkB/YihY/UPF0761 family membrane protein
MEEGDKPQARLYLMVAWMLFLGSILIAVVATLWNALGGFWGSHLSDLNIMLLGGAQAFFILSFIFLMFSGGYFFGGRYPRTKFFSCGTIFASVVACSLEVVMSFQAF